jgi:hypothetical protein
MTARSLLMLLALPACLLKPSPPGNGVDDANRAGDGGSGGSGSGSDGSGSGSDGSGVMKMVPRVIANAYYSEGLAHSSGMTGSGYSISTAGIIDGDVVLLIANIDNGINDDFELPGPNFTRLFDYKYGADGQTYFAAYAIAHDEGAVYTGAYTQTGGSQNAAMTLLAIAGADTSNPINYFNDHLGSNAVQSPIAEVTGGSDATTTDSCVVVVAAGADWENSAGGTVVEEVSSEVMLLAELTDEGNLSTNLEWTSQTVGWFPQPTAGPLGSNSIKLVSGSAEMGQPWGIVIAVAPAP